MKNQKAFTLIELLVVVAIIGLLSSVVIVGLKDAKERAEEKTAMEFAHTVRVSLGSDLVGEWTFDDSTNLGKDTSGNDNHGTNNGVAPTDGIIRGAGDFNGGNEDYVITSDTLEIPQEYTLAIWIKGNLADQVLTDNIYAFGWYGKVELSTNGGGATAPRGGILIRNENDTLYRSYWDGTNVLDGKWHFWVVTVNRNAKDIYIYLDGEEIHYVHHDNVADHYSDPTQVFIGAWNTTYGNFTGLLDEARIYNRALTTAEIQKHYAKGATKYNIALR